MGRSVIKCDNCGADVMEGYAGEWDCDVCGWTYNANKGVINKGVPKYKDPHKLLIVSVNKEIDELENFPLSECQQAMVNFIRRHLDDFITEEEIK